MSFTDTVAELRRARRVEALMLRAAGWSLREIARHLGVSHASVLRDLRAADGHGPSRTAPPIDPPACLGPEWT